MPIYLCDHPAGAVPAFGLLGHIYVFDLDAAFRRAAHRPVQMRFNQLCQHRIAAQTNDIGNPFFLAEIVDGRIGECRVPPQPKIIELLAISVDNGFY
jgi:hypothetical protein